MKTGDLVAYKHSHPKGIGLILEVGVYVGRKDVKIYWPSLNEIHTEFQKSLEVISESR